MSSAQPGLAKPDRFKGCIPGLFENDPACATCGPARPPNSHRPLDRLHQLAPEAGPFGADADLVAEVLDQVQVGKVTRSWSAAGTVAESPDQDRRHRLVEAGVLRSSKEPLSILAAGSAAAADIRCALRCAGTMGERR